MRPDAGSINIFGLDVLADPLAAKRMIAWIPDEPMLYDKLVRWNILNSSPACGASSGDGAASRQGTLETLELWAHRNERCEGFSRGMKQKAALAGALIHEPSF